MYRKSYSFFRDSSDEKPWLVVIMEDEPGDEKALEELLVSIRDEASELYATRARVVWEGSEKKGPRIIDEYTIDFYDDDRWIGKSHFYVETEAEVVVTWEYSAE